MVILSVGRKTPIPSSSIFFPDVILFRGFGVFLFTCLLLKVKYSNLEEQHLLIFLILSPVISDHSSLFRYKK